MQNTKSNTYHQEALAAWEILEKEQPLPDDAATLKKMLQEAQVQVLEMQYEAQELTRNKDLLWSILDTLPNAVFVKDIQNDYKFCLWNKKAEELFGLSAEACIGKSDYDFFEKENADWFRQKDLEVSQLEGILNIPEEVVESENKTVLVHTQKKVVRESSGEPSFLVGVSEDITLRKKTEQELFLLQQKTKESEEKFRAITEQASEAITIADLDGNYVFVNDAFCNMMGYSEAELMLMTVFDMKQDPNELQIFNQAKNGSTVGEVFLKRKNNEVLLTSISAKSIYIGEQQFLLGIITDITERRAAEQELKDSKEQLEKLFELSPDFMLKTRIDNLTFVDINQRACEIYGYTKEEFRNLNLYDIEIAPSAKTFKETGYKDLPIGKVFTAEGIHRKKDGSTFPVFVRICKLDEEYELAAVTDISAQKRMADILKESEELAKAKKTAEDSEKRLKEAQHIALIGYWELNATTKEEIWSDELYQIFELSPLEAIPSESDFLQNLHPEDRNFAHQTYLEMTEKKQPYEIIYRLLLKNGKIKYVNERCRAEFDEMGNHLRSIGTLQDITEQKNNEENLGKSIKEIQDLKYALDQSAMVVRIDKAYKVMTANANFCKMSGFDEKELIGQPFDIADLEHHSKWFLQNLWTTVQQGAVWKGELKCKTKNGLVYWTDTAIVPFIDEHFSPFQYIVIQRDITEEKRLQEELDSANEAEFAKLYQQQKLHIAQIEERGKELDRFFNLSMDMISVITFDGTVKRINPAFLKVLGYTQEELFAQPLYNLIHPNDLAKTYAEVAKMEKGMDLMHFENRYRTKNGDYRWLSWRTVLDKEAKLCYAITRDITEDRKAIKEIEDLKYTLDQTAIVMTVGRDEKILSVNDKFCEISGYSREEVIGQHHEILDSLHHSAEFWVNLRATIESGQIWQGEIKERAKDGSFYWTYTSSVPFLNEDGESFQYIVIQSDITERKKLEEALHWAKEEAVKNAKIKEDFLANMSHEIRTPMSGVLGFARLLLQTNLEQVQQNYAQSIYNCAESLLVVVNDILDVSKIESGKLQLEEVEFDLEKRIHDTLAILKIAIEKKELNLIVDIDKNIPNKIVSVPNRISQVLINLIGNSVKFTKKGFIQLSIKRLDNKILLFEVTDSGIGIPADKLDMIFDSFTQAASYTTREHGGTGLGLSICRKLVAMMGGEISVKSELNKGTTFSFTIPFKTDISSSTTINKQQDSKFELIPNATSDTKVLVVEDNLVNQELALIYLNILNCNCDLANNGEEALLKLSKQSYDLILMDIQMPKMDGITATIEIRKNNPSTPIVAMTAHALSKEKEKCFEIGMNDYISKPFKIEDLQEVILKHTKGHIKLYEKKNESSTPIPNAKKITEIDFEHLVRMMDNNRQLAQELLMIFKKELVKFSENMQLAILERDTTAIRKHIHKIKPNFELLRLMDLYEIADNIHALAAASDAAFQDIEALYRKIEEVIPELLRMEN